MRDGVMMNRLEEEDMHMKAEETKSDRQENHPILQRHLLLFVLRYLQKCTHPFHWREGET